MNSEKRDFDAAAASWDENPVRVRLARDVADSIREGVPLSTGIDAADFGCGTGLLTLRLQPLVRSVTGVDSSRGMLEVLDRKVRDLGLSNVRTQYLDIDRGETLTGRYGLIASSMTLHHIRDVGHLLRMFRSCLLPSGNLCIADLDTEDGGFHGDSGGVFHQGFDRDWLRGEFETAGFQLVRDRTAAAVEKPGADGKLRRFTVFLMTGHAG